MLRKRGKLYRNISREEARIFLIEAAPEILNGYSPTLAQKARKMLEELGVQVLLNTAVTNIEKGRVTFKEGAIETSNIIWAAGVVVSPLVKTLDAEHDRNGRVFVKPDLSIPGHPDVFVIGDAAHVKDKHGIPLPAVASAATQQGRFLGKLLCSEKSPSENRPSFQYVDKGSIATIGQARAIADIKGFKVSGFMAWVLWSLVHMLFLIGFRNRFHVFVEWLWYYFTFKRGVRLITARPGSRHCKAVEKPKEYKPENIPLSPDSLPLN